MWYLIVKCRFSIRPGALTCPLTDPGFRDWLWVERRWSIMLYLIIIQLLPLIMYHG